MSSAAQGRPEGATELVERLLLEKVSFERNILATLLPAIAGAVNASGFFAVGTYTSHMTGVVSRAGDELAQQHLWLALRAFALLSSFVFGAMVATALVLYARERQKPAFWRPLSLEAALLFCFASFSVGAGRGAYFHNFTMTAVLCAAMGLQNALITKLSGARIRTTHLTGVSTDIGIELTKTLRRWRARSVGKSLADTVNLAGEVSLDAEARHLRLHLRVLGCFLAGAIAGPALYLVVGHWAMLAPVALLVALAVFDLRAGLGSAA
ncbi:MAG TPA: YoaK family protein [Myxococcales bacterium]|jgi:uncharacterized membrane protein YoaK (UPF0700 family)